MWTVTAVYQGRVNRDDEKPVMTALNEAFAGRLSDDKINIHLELGGGMVPTATFTLNPLTFEEAKDLFDLPYEIGTMGLVSKSCNKLPDPPSVAQIGGLTPLTRGVHSLQDLLDSADPEVTAYWAEEERKTAEANPTGPDAMKVNIQNWLSEWQRRAAEMKLRETRE
jgi:hypothetical protein